MSVDVYIPPELSKKEKYEVLFPQLTSLIEGEPDLIANLANICGALKQTFNFFWVGFYLVKGNELVLGPYQGPVACNRIGFGKGVCGSAWAENRTIIVDDVNTFPGHISCNPASRSEIVIPVSKSGTPFLVLDIDSDRLADFNETDSRFLNKMLTLLGPSIGS